MTSEILCFELLVPGKHGGGGEVTIKIVAHATQDEMSKLFIRLIEDFHKNGLVRIWICSLYIQ